MAGLTKWHKNRNFQLATVTWFFKIHHSNFASYLEIASKFQMYFSNLKIRSGSHFQVGGPIRPPPRTSLLYKKPGLYRVKDIMKIFIFDRNFAPTFTKTHMHIHNLANLRVPRSQATQYTQRF